MKTDAATGAITREQIAVTRHRVIEPWAQGKVSDETIVGKMVSECFYMDSSAVLRAVYAALEDQNYHELNAYIVSRYPHAFYKVTP